MTWNTQPDPINTISGSGELDLSAGTVIATGSSIARTLADRFAVVYNVKDYGAVGDGQEDDSSAIREVVDLVATFGALGGGIFFPPGRYRVGSSIPITLNRVTLFGYGATISKEFNGDLFTSGGINNFHNLQFDGNGATYTGAIWRFLANSFGQHISGCYVDNAADGIMLFEDNGASFGRFHDNIYHINATASSPGAVVKRTTSVRDTAATIRHFHHEQCVGPGTMYADVDGAFSMYFDHIYSNGIQLGDNCLGCTIQNARMAILSSQGQPDCHLSGNTTMVTMCLFGGNLTIDNGFIYGSFVNNTMDPTATFTDNSTKLNVDSIPIVEKPRYAGGRQVPVMDTAQLPAVSAEMDGRIIIENAGAGDRNLIVYAGGQRFRIDGGANF